MCRKRFGALLSGSALVGPVCRAGLRRAWTGRTSGPARQTGPTRGLKRSLAAKLWRQSAAVCGIGWEAERVRPSLYGGDRCQRGTDSRALLFRRSLNSLSCPIPLY